MVELVGGYSNIPELPNLDDSTSVQLQDPHHPRVHRADRRLAAEQVARLVADYQAGTPTTQLTTKYALGKGTVLRLLRRHGVEIRNQPMNQDEIDQAIQLYQDGWSLARVGQHLGREHTVIRDVLVKAGIPRRDTHGRPR